MIFKKKLKKKDFQKRHTKKIFRKDFKKGTNIWATLLKTPETFFDLE